MFYGEYRPQSRPFVLYDKQAKGLARKGVNIVGRARKQKHGLPLADGKGRVDNSADESAIPRQAKTSLKRHTKKKG